MANISENSSGANQTGERLLRLIELMSGKAEPVHITEIADECGINVSTISRLMSTLQAAGYVSKDTNTNLYSLTYKICKLSDQVKKNMDIVRIVRPYLKKLANDVKHTVGLYAAVEENARCICRIDDYAAEPAGPAAEESVPMYCFAAGKLFLLSHTAEQLRKKYGEGSMTAYTRQTITSADELRRELLQAHVQGYSTDWNEYQENTADIAAPIRDYSNRIIAAICISSKSAGMSPEQIYSVVTPILNQAAVISELMGYNAREDREPHARR